MRTKPYAGEKVIYEPRKASWWGPGDVSVSQALFLDPMMQQQIRNGTYHFGQFYVTNKRIIFEGDESSKECIIYLEETKAFRYERGGWLAWANSLYVTKENSPEEKFMIKDAEPDITKNLHSAREAAIHTKAIHCEEHLDYARAISLWENLGKPQEAARIRKLVAEQSAVKVDQTVIHGDYVDDRDTTYIDDRDTIIQDSVVSKSNIGAGGDDKFAKLDRLAEIKEKGLIDDDEFKQMKKEILGK